MALDIIGLLTNVISGLIISIGILTCLYIICPKILYKIIKKILFSTICMTYDIVVKPIATAAVSFATDKYFINENDVKIIS